MKEHIGMECQKSNQTTKQGRNDTTILLYSLLVMHYCACPCVYSYRLSSLYLLPFCVASLRLNHCNCFTEYRGRPVKETIIIIRIRIRKRRLATCRCGTSAMLSDTANNLIIDKNTGERQVWLIKAHDYI